MKIPVSKALITSKIVSIWSGRAGQLKPQRYVIRVARLEAWRVPYETGHGLTDQYVFKTFQTFVIKSARHPNTFSAKSDNVYNQAAFIFQRYHLHRSPRGLYITFEEKRKKKKLIMLRQQLPHLPQLSSDAPPSGQDCIQSLTFSVILSRFLKYPLAFLCGRTYHNVLAKLSHFWMKHWACVTVFGWE